MQIHQRRVWDPELFQRSPSQLIPENPFGNIA
jgi:hypothetical protein